MKKLQDLDIPLYMKKLTNVRRVRDIVGPDELTVCERYQTTCYRIIDSFKPISIPPSSGHDTKSNLTENDLP